MKSMKQSITLSLWLLSLMSKIISSMVNNNNNINDTKDFCEEYKKNDYKIDFAFRYIQTSNQNDFYKYFIIGNNLWELTFIDGSDDNKTVTINTDSNVNHKLNNWLSGNNYSMAWAYTSYWLSNDLTVGALHKTMKTISWLKNNTKFSLIKSIIQFDNNFKPMIAWTPLKWSPIVSFMDKNGLTEVYNFTDFNKPTKNLSLTDRKFMFVIDSKREQQIHKRIKLMAIIGQWSDYDYNQYIDSQTPIAGFGSIVFTYVDNNTSIKYCYAGNPFNETACKPEHLKTLINCLSNTLTTTTTTTTSDTTLGIYLLITVILIVILIVLVILIIAVVYHYWIGRQVQEKLTDRVQETQLTLSSEKETDSQLLSVLSPSKTVDSKFRYSVIKRLDGQSAMSPTKTISSSMVSSTKKIRK